MAANSHMIIVISAIFCLFVFSFSEAIQDNFHGTTTSLFHRDSPLSPHYDPSLSRYDRLKDAYLRSIARSKAILNRANSALSPNLIQSPLTPNPNGGEFFMNLLIGTPPVEFVAIADTGSDLTWTQCLPCKNCYNQSRPIFDPRRSSSYRQMPCSSVHCQPSDVAGCGFENRTCEYNYSYGDQSFTNGEFAFEKIALGSSSGRPFLLRNSIIGCGHENGGTFDRAGSGIIGLGGGSLSLVSQLNTTAGIRRRFSYCLPNMFDDSRPSGKINFGRNAVVSGRRVVSTPLIDKYPDTYYYLTLEGVSVGKTRLPFQTAAGAASSVGKGNIIIDSGTTFTFMPANLYNSIVSTLKKLIKAKPVKDPFHLLDLCYETDGSDDDLKIPTMTAHFTGADVKLPPLNTFAHVADNVTCLTFTQSSDLGIFGNLAQMNHLIEYDLDERRLFIKPKVCS